MRGTEQRKPPHKEADWPNRIPRSSDSSGTDQGEVRADSAVAQPAALKNALLFSKTLTFFARSKHQ